MLAAAGAILAGASLAAHLSGFRSLNEALGAGFVGSVLLLLAQLAYVPNAVIWAVCFTLGPGFAFGAGTVVAPTGAALGPLPMFPMLAAMPSGAHLGLPGLVSVAMLSRALSGRGVRRAAAGAGGAEPGGRDWPRCGGSPAAWPPASLTGLLAAFSGGPLGSGRLAVVGPSGWQAGLVATLEVGVAAAVAAGLANWLRLRREPGLAAAAAAGRAGRRPAPAAEPGRRRAPDLHRSVGR